MSMLIGFGAVTTDTLRPQDLIPKFLKELRNFPEHYARFIGSPYKPGHPFIWDAGGTSELWDSEEAAEMVIELQNAITDALPEGVSFCEHPDDPACIGYWPDMALKDYIKGLDR